MKDITKYFVEASTIDQNRSFNSKNWELSILRYVSEVPLELIWYDEHDQWIKMGHESDLLIVTARNLPLLFVKYEYLILQFKNYYKQELVCLYFDDPNKVEFNIDFKSLGTLINWNSSVVSTKEFSLNDLFYATH